MRTVIVSIFVVLLFAGILFLYSSHAETAGRDISSYYIFNFAADTGAGNAVAAIYLNYRVYDTIFEALILLVSIVAMLHFFQAGGTKKHD
ncbi:hypothetical protein [Spirochaeta dissipatitropha]